MKAYVIKGPRNAAVSEVPIPVPGYDEVLIRVERTGICGTDVHIYKGEYVSRYPIIPGHEFSGTIVELGEGASAFQIGDRVTAEPNIHCGRCMYCLSHRGNHCDHAQAIGVTRNGAMAEYVAVPVNNVFKLPTGMSFATGAFIEPLACVVHAMNRLQLSPGSRTLLFGAGAMGQQLIQALIHTGVTELAVVDIADKKLTMAKQWGATKTILSERLGESAIRSEFPRGFDVVVDATGIPSVIEQALTFLGPAGKFLQFGVTAKTAAVQLNPFELFQRDWTLIGSAATNDTFLPALHWAQAGRIQLEPLVTKVVALDELPRLFEHGASPEDMKIQIKLR
ncbi:MAG: zinc-dependent alcohol dehydrogenase family protein [Cohnella sp.]|nr:zinc-dependent alcohol dehydrogenase family protein [Cohnella sp.]